MSDIILSNMLADLGCPYEAGTPESVAWLHGFAFGFARMARIVFPGETVPTLAAFALTTAERAKAN